MTTKRSAKWKKYAALFALAVKQTLKNVKVLVGLSIFLITCLLIFSHLWQVAATRAGAIAFNPQQLLWYIAFNEWILIAIPDIQLDIEHDLRSGRLAYFLPRPISYIGAKLAEGMGMLVVHLAVLGVVAFGFTWLWTKSLPFDSLTFLFSLGLGIFAGWTALIFHVLVGLSAFWLHEVAPFNWIWEKLLFVFGGLILPLSVYPGWMQAIAYWTPFSVILGERSSLIFTPTFTHGIWLVLVLTCWSTIGLLLLAFVYRRGLRVLNIEGG